jgi:hypothetical protein
MAAYVHVIEFDTFHVANEEAVGRRDAEHARFRIHGLVLGGRECCLLLRAATLVYDSNVAEFHVFDIVTGNAADDGAKSRVRIVDPRNL